MKWQDLVFTAGSWIFIFALLPMIRAKEKPPVFSSASTGSVLWVFSITYLTLGLPLSAITTALTAWCWTLLMIQRLILTSKRKHAIIHESISKEDSVVSTQY